MPRNRLRLCLALLVPLVGCADDPAGPRDIAAPKPADAAPASIVKLPPCTAHWAAPVSGDWAVAGNWSPAVVPGWNAVACLDAVGTYTVTLNGPRVVNAIVVGAKGAAVTLSYSNAGVLAAWNVTTGIHVKVGSTLKWNDPVDLTTGFVQVDGTWRADFPGDAAVVDADSIRIGGTVDVNGADLALNVGAFHNTGTLQATGSAATLTITGDAFGAVWMEGGTVSGQGTVVATTVPPSLGWPVPPYWPAVFHWTAGTIPARLTGPGARLRVIGMPISLDATTLQGVIELETVYINFLGVIWATPVVTSDGSLPAGVRLDITGNGQASLPQVNHGTITVTPTDSMTLWAPVRFLDNAGSFTINASPARVRMEVDSVENSGTLTLGGPADFPTLARIHNRGTITSSTAAPLDLGGADFVAESGSSQSGPLSLAGGVLSGAGAVGNVTSVGGTISPGATPASPALPGLGTLTLASLFLDPASTVSLDIAGTAPDKHDLLAVTGLVVYNGALRLIESSGFLGGHCGEVVPIVTDGSFPLVRGAFASTTGLTPGAARGWRLYNPTASLQLVGHDPSVPVSVSPAGVTVTEGGAGASYNVCLRSAPTANVTLTPSAAGGQLAAFAPLTFFTSSWALPGFVTVGAVDDAVVEPPPQLATIAHAVASADPAYAGAMPAPVTATIVDNDGVTNLELHVFSAPPVVTVGSSFTLTLQNENLGPNTSVGATFTIPASTGFSYSSSTGTLGCSYDGISGTTCQLPSLASGGKTDFTVTLTAVLAGVYPTVYTISTIQGDSNPLNNARSQTITIN